MDVLVDAANNEDLLVVLNRLGAEEFLGLLERAIVPLHLILLCVECEAVADPAVVSAEDEDFLVVEWEAAHGVAGTPVVLAIGELDWLPARLEKVVASVKTLNTIEGLFVLGIAATNAVNVAVLEYTDSMVVARLGELSDLGPLVLGHFIDLTLLGSLVRVL